MAHKGYTLNYFINFFSSIPDHQWCEGTLNREGTVQCCALGHALRDPRTNKIDHDQLQDRLDMNPTSKVVALEEFLNDRTAEINDGQGRFSQLGKTPRGRILKALRTRKRNGTL